MLFFIQSPGSQIVSYLFGTMHASNEYAYSYYELALKYLSRCSVFAAEVDFSDPEMQDIGEIFKLPESTHIKDYVSINKYNKIRNQLIKSFDFDIEYFGRMQPMFILNIFLSDILPKVHPQPLDHALYRVALQSKLDITGLESMDDQINIVRRLDLDQQFIQLKSIAQNPSKARSNTLRLMEYYAKGDISTLYHLGRRSLGKYRHVLLTERNHKMTNRLFSIVGSTSIFAAVGAGHLYGNNGMLKLLKNKGLKVVKVID